MLETTTNIQEQDVEPNDIEKKALKKLRCLSRLNKVCIISLFVTLTILCIIALTMFAEVAIKIVLLFEQDEILSNFLQKDILTGRILFYIFIPSAVVSLIFISVYSFVLKIFEKAILEIMSNANLENWYNTNKIDNNSLYLFRYMYNQYELDKLKGKLNQKQKKIFQGLNTVLYPDNYCLEDMNGFSYELYTGSFFDILVRLSANPSNETVKEIIDDYSEERNLKNLKERNKKNIKENNILLGKISWKYYFFVLKVGMLVTMIIWLGKNLFFPEPEYGVFYSNYFNICAVFLLGTEIWERRKDFLFFNRLDDYGTKKKP